MAFQEKSSLYDVELNAGCMKSHPLLRATWDGDIESFTRLVEEQLSGAAKQEPRTPDLLCVRDNFENCALHVASYRGNTRILELLIGVCGCDPNVKNEQGWAPIHFSCRGNDYDALKMLLKHGADPSLRNVQGYSAYHIAAENNMVDAIRLFMQYPSDCDVESFSGITPLTCAAQQGNKEICVMLATHGADIFHRNTLFENGEHQTPQRLALSHGLDLRQVGAVPETPVPPTLSRQKPGESRVIWQPTAGRSAPVRGYKLQVRKIDTLQPELPWVTAIEGIKELGFTFYTCCNDCSSFGRDKVDSDLEPGEVYTVRLYAESAVGWSNPSPPSQPFVTEPAAPTMPTPPELVEATSTSLRVRWKLPEGNGAPVDRSELYWKLSHTPYGKWQALPDPVLVSNVNSDDEVSSLESDTDDEPDPSRREVWCTYTMKNLAQNAQYRFKVRCRNFVGWSYLSPESHKMKTNSDKSILRLDRRGADATGASGGDEVRSTNFIGEHAHKRYVMFQRNRQDRGRVTNQKQAELDKYLEGSRTNTAATVIQSWVRCIILRDLYKRYKEAYSSQEYMLLEYDMVDQFNSSWREKLNRFQKDALVKASALQKLRDEKRARKIARRSRREQRNVRRQLRKENKPSR